MNNLLDIIFKNSKRFKHWLIAYYIILFPLVDNRHCRYTGWHNKLDAFDYNALGLRFNEVSNIYTDLFSNQYWYDNNQQIYFNDQGMRFDISGLNYSSDKSRAIDFLGNHYYWCFTRNRYIYAKLWSSRLMGHSLVKASFQPMTAPLVAAQVFLLKNPLELTFFKTRFNKLLIVSFIIININPITELRMIQQNQPLKSEPTQVVGEFRFQNTETLKQSKAQNTRPLSKRLYKKSTRVSASANTSTYGFDLDSQANMVNLNLSKDPQKYDSIDLLQDLGKCLDVYSKTFEANQQKQHFKQDSSLKKGIKKLYKQIDIATNIAREKQERLKQEPVIPPNGALSVKRLNENIQKTAFGRNEKPIQKDRKKKIGFSRRIAQQLREHNDLSLSGIKTLVTIKNDPNANLTKEENTQIAQFFARTPNGQKIKALGLQTAHIIPDAWSLEPRIETREKVSQFELPFPRFSALVINNNENFVSTPVFLEKIMNKITKIEAGVLPEFIKIKYDPAWRPEKNYLIVNAISHDFYLPALSENEKRFVIQKRNK